MFENGKTHHLLKLALNWLSSISYRSRLEFYRDIKKFLFTVRPTTYRQNSSRVECVAVNSTGHQAVKQFEVVYFTRPEVVVDRSSVENGTVSVKYLFLNSFWTSLSTFMTQDVSLFRSSADTLCGGLFLSNHLTLTMIF